jgi:hypothetical protein
VVIAAVKALKASAVSMDQQGRKVRVVIAELQVQVDIVEQLVLKASVAQADILAHKVVKVAKVQKDLTERAFQVVKDTQGTVEQVVTVDIVEVA